MKRQANNSVVNLIYHFIAQSDGLANQFRLSSAYGGGYWDGGKCLAKVKK